MLEFAIHSLHSLIIYIYIYLFRYMQNVRSVSGAQIYIPLRVDSGNPAVIWSQFLFRWFLGWSMSEEKRPKDIWLMVINGD